LARAIAIGNPTFGAELFGQILSGALGSQGDLARWCHMRTSQLAGRSTRDRSTLSEVTKRLEVFGDWPALRKAVRRVARFSFETGRVLAAHLADDEPEGEAEPS